MRPTAIFARFKTTGKHSDEGEGQKVKTDQRAKPKHISLQLYFK
jgi:hypothetical protein